MYGKVQLISRLSIKPQKHKMVKKDVWLEEAHIRFFEQGITGINIEDISKTIGVAKTSFYHFFNSKEEFLEKLFEKWEYEGTDLLIAKFSPISDPISRIENVLNYVFTKNIENEIFLMQLQRLALIDTLAAKYLIRAKKKRMAFTLKFFTDMGYETLDAEKKAMLWYTYATGRITNKDNKKFSNEEILSVNEEIKYVTRININN